MEKSFGLKEGRPRPSIRKRYVCLAQLTDRGLYDYKLLLHLPVSELRGKQILDIGSGDSERFAREMSAQQTMVVSLNPKWGEKDAMQAGFNYKKLEWLQPRQSVAGVAQSLPFRDESFDVAVSLFGVPLYLPPYKFEYKAAFLEILRVLKSRGSAYLYPLHEYVHRDKHFQGLIAELAPRLCTATVEADWASDRHIRWSKNVGDRGGGDDEVYRLVITKR